MIVWYAYNWVTTGNSYRPNLFSTKAKAIEWAKKDSIRQHGGIYLDNYTIDVEEVR